MRERKVHQGPPYERSFLPGAKTVCGIKLWPKDRGRRKLKSLVWTENKFRVTCLKCAPRL